jgi:capsular polysaccharide biosynthesis protein
VLEELAASFTISRGSPGTKTFHDVIYLPQYACLYSAEGVRIDESCLYRGRLRINVTAAWAPATIEPIRDLRRLDFTLIYVGAFFSHFGHFLTEGIARYWFTAKDEGHSILAHYTERNFSRLTHFDRFFQAIQFPRERLVAFDQPVRIKEVILPDPSFTYAYEGVDVHRLLPENVAEQILRTTPERTSQPLYLSRRRLGKGLRVVVNERILEENLRARRFLVVCPERLSLDQQIHLINKHEVIMGMRGSALHGMLFDLSPERCRNMICFVDERGNFDANFLIIDAIKSIKSTYIGALKPIGPPAHRPDRQNRVLDLDIAIGALKEIGLW